MLEQQEQIDPAEEKKKMKKRNNFLKKLRKKNDSVKLSESKYGEPNHYISTGSYALNRIISGDIYKGIPAGRIVIWAGENSVGKSLAVTCCAGEALKMGYDMIFVFDAELGASKSFFENFNCDPEFVEQVLVDSVEDCQLKMVYTLNQIQEFQKEDPDFKAMFIVDSIGALVSNKLHTDADKGKVVSDMGLRAKLCNNMIKALTVPAAKAGVAINIINHCYADPAAMYASKIKNQGGGEGLKYMASVNIQIAKKLQKNEDSEIENEYSGNHMVFFTVKNRLVKPFHRTEIFIDFNTGMRKYDGLFDAAVKHGFLVEDGTKYRVPSLNNDVKYWRDELIGNKELKNKSATLDEIWGSFLEEFNTVSKEDIQYSSVSKQQQLNKIFDDIEEKVEKIDITEYENLLEQDPNPVCLNPVDIEIE